MSKDIAVNIPLAKEIEGELKFKIISIYSVLLIGLGFLLDSPTQILKGIISIIKSPSILLTDYMVVGGLGAAFVNAGLVGIIGLVLVRIEKINISGPIIAAIFTMVGFALFGKNILNIWPIFIGVYIYSKIKEDKFGKYIIPALFGTTLAPMVSQVALGFEFEPVKGIILSITFGILAGFVLPPLATHMLSFHKGYNIYNLGFTGGVVGTVFMALFRGRGLEGGSVLIWGEGFNDLLIPIFALYFSSMIVLGLILDSNSIKLLKHLIQNPGTLVTDFTSINGFGATFINMGLVGLIGLVYIVLVGADLNGPTLGGLFTMVGFGAFGKHVKNIIPIIVGVYLGTFFKVWSPADPGAILAALFGTTLAPLAGAFGPFVGIFAGFLHLSVVMNVGFLHGGMHLYNNGFAGGIVAAVIIGVLGAFINMDK